MAPLGPQNAEVKTLRKLVRDRAARRSAGKFVIEGMRAIQGALDRDVKFDVVYVDTTARASLSSLSGDLGDVRELEAGVLQQVADAQTPQPVLAVAEMQLHTLEDIDTKGWVMVVADCNDPGNAGTIMRSAEAAGASAVVFTGMSVDPYNPKAVRASAGAVCGIFIAEDADTMASLQTMQQQGRRIVGTAAKRGNAYYQTDLTRSLALVLGSEAHGISSEVEPFIDEWVHIPLTENAESLNVAMASSILAFEIAKQRSAVSQ